ncbi:uncharacterized protein CTHT_0029900 [Thermochaetoides thermophila DSM 1495]|uniref:Uncharacterized protein n=1 Tax=Chaetomium thermophilum (strain DSM 1495 / CBS 144.50 / IMI 039719) TaxID=759272 RepID=G0S8H5_CHATD|nr:hypothetical protein CTHT_0029900 [Thermochaetoides thermophila DSM 1495]EGS21149.1 hypothetical protein CTHT_0029900 [Thermochaetoides thermophila DSM 1495]
MDFPTIQTPSSTRSKRKRSNNTKSSPANNEGTDRVINPHSHTPDTLRQFALAGYPADAPAPAEVWPGFPHRAPDRRRHFRFYYHPDEQGDRGRNGKGEGRGPSRGDGVLEGDREQAEGEEGDADVDSTTAVESGDDGHTYHHRRRRHRRKSSGANGLSAEEDRKARAYRAHVGWLTTILRRALATNDLPTAKRAFGLLIRASVYGKPVDLRYERLWEMGGEILLREGDQLLEQVQKNDRGQQQGGVTEEAEGETERDEGQDWLWQNIGIEAGSGPRQTSMSRREKWEREDRVAEERLEKLKGYFGYLVQQYPYSRQHAGSAGPVVDFQVALFGIELEEIWRAHKRGLERLDEEAADPDEEDPEVDEEMPEYDFTQDYDLHDGNDEGVNRDSYSQDYDYALPRHSPKVDDPLRDLTPRERRLHTQRITLYKQTLSRLASLSERMDSVMETLPFSRDAEMLRLRAMVALYAGDVAITPRLTRSIDETIEGRRERLRQRGKAREMLARMREVGGEMGELERIWRELVKEEEEEEEREEREEVGF